MDEAEDALTWVRIMSERYRWGGDPGDTLVDAEELGAEGRAGVQFLFEWLYFEGLLDYRYRKGQPRA